MKSKRNWFIYPYLAFSLFFMFDYATGIISSIPGAFGQIITGVQSFIIGDYTLLFYGYAAFLFLLAMASIRQTPTGLFTRFIQRIGRSTYHILLFQIFWMSIVYWVTSPDAIVHHFIPDFEVLLGWGTPLNYIPFYLLNLVISFTGGMIWYEVERQLFYYEK